MKTRLMTVDLENDLGTSRCYSMQILPKLLDFFDDNNIKATFFTVTSLLEKHESEIKEIAQKHEIASHSHTHLDLNLNNAEFEIRTSKEKLKEFGINCRGFRAPKLITTKDHFQLLKKYGYSYDSSLGVYFPGRYNNLKLPKKPFLKNELVEFPMPTFIYPAVNSGLSYLKLLHPLSKTFSQRYLFYLHPWEFLEKKHLPKSNSLITSFLRRNTGRKAWKIFQDYITKENVQWVSCREYLEKR